MALLYGKRSHLHRRDVQRHAPLLQEEQECGARAPSPLT
jgi:hypothetical protein